ncbi:MAG: hypothetical protein IKT23_02330, partial [Clostridia bacterium]|nr:hypothetical protein [Clostridia bacterium]
MKNKRLIACLLAVLFLLPMIPVNLAYAEPAWSSDFQSFVLNQEYFQTGLNFNSDAYYQTRFTLYDFERDGEPELLVFNGGPSLAQMTVYVFQHTSWGINHVGNVGFRSCQLFYYDDPSFPGVFCTEGNNGNFRTVYYELQDNSIISEDVTDSGITGDPIYLPFYTLDEIRATGWGEFVRITCGISEEKWNESADETYSDENEDTISTQQQFASNIFLSNFSEQHAFERRDFDINNPFVDDLVNFAYLYCKINRHSLLSTAEVNGSYFYTLSPEDANTVLNRHFAITLSEAEAAQFPVNEDPSARYHSYYSAGFFYFPAADGESYNRFTVVREIEPLSGGQYRMYFDIYKLDILEYRRTDGVDTSFYYLSAGQAENDSRLTWENSGVAIVTPYNNNGTDTYQLQYDRVGENKASNAAPISENRLYAQDGIGSPVVEINPDGTETVVQENGTGSIVQENGTGSIVQENGTG